MNLCCRMDGHCTDDLVWLDLRVSDQRGTDSVVVFEVEELCEKLVFVSIDCLVEVLSEIELEDECALLANDGHENVF